VAEVCIFAVFRETRLHNNEHISLHTPLLQFIVRINMALEKMHIMLFLLRF